MQVESTQAHHIPAIRARLNYSPEHLQVMVRNLCQRLNSAIGDFPKLHYAMRDLERLLLRGEEYDADFGKLLSSFADHELAHFHNLYCYWETLLEKRFVQYLDQGIFRHVVDYPLFSRFERLIEREVSLLDGHMPSRVLFIGSGPMPITALCLQHRIETRVDCLERDPEAVSESRLVLDRLGYAEKIHVLHGRGEMIDVSSYDVILVALLAKPKHAILESIARTCRDDVRIICRTSEGSRCFFYEPTTLDAIPPTLRWMREAHAGIDDTISSSLLRKVGFK